MTAAKVLDQLIAMSRVLGDPALDYAILGEGNSSARIDEDTFWVKASGAEMRTIEAGGFVQVRFEPVLALLAARTMLPEKAGRPPGLGFEGVDVWSAHAGCPHLDDVLDRLGAERTLACKRMQHDPFQQVAQGSCHWLKFVTLGVALPASRSARACCINRGVSIVAPRRGWNAAAPGRPALRRRRSSSRH